MTEGLTGELGLPPIDQVAYVVKDLDRAIERFEPLFGPVQVMEIELRGTDYRGRKSDVGLKLGFARSGSIEIELIEVVSGESPHTEFLNEHGDGPHHVRCVVQDMDPIVARAEKNDFEVIWSHEMQGSGTRFVYLERDGTVLELLESSSPIQVS